MDQIFQAAQHTCCCSLAAQDTWDTPLLLRGHWTPALHGTDPTLRGQPGRGAPSWAVELLLAHSQLRGTRQWVDQGQVLVLSQLPASPISQGSRSLKAPAGAAGAQAGGSTLGCFLLSGYQC